MCRKGIQSANRKLGYSPSGNFDVLLPKWGGLMQACVNLAFSCTYCTFMVTYTVCQTRTDVVYLVVWTINLPSTVCLRIAIGNFNLLAETVQTNRNTLKKMNENILLYSLSSMIIVESILLSGYRLWKRDFFYDFFFLWFPNKLAK